jgi:predicted regulator of amino acid metabolism with ACT domain
MKFREVTLAVNDAPIELNEFVTGYIARVVEAILASLKRTGVIKQAAVSLAKDQVSIVLNDKRVPLNPFVTHIVHNTIAGMVSALKGVNAVDTIQITVGT